MTALRSARGRHAQGAGVLRARRSQAQLDRAGIHPVRTAAATINAIAQGETRFGTTQGGTPTSLTFSRISQFQGSIKRAGSPVGNLTGSSVTYSNNLEKIETIRDDGLIESADPTIASLTGRIDVRFAETTLINLAAGGTPVDLEKLVLTGTTAGDRETAGRHAENAAQRAGLTNVRYWVKLCPPRPSPSTTGTGLRPDFSHVATTVGHGADPLWKGLNRLILLPLTS
jgi:hypothetical protein